MLFLVEGDTPSAFEGLGVAKKLRRCSKGRAILDGDAPEAATEDTDASDGGAKLGEEVLVIADLVGVARCDDCMNERGRERALGGLPILLGVTMGLRCVSLDLVEEDIFGGPGSAVFGGEVPFVAS